MHDRGINMSSLVSPIKAALRPAMNQLRQQIQNAQFMKKVVEDRKKLKTIQVDEQVQYPGSRIVWLTEQIGTNHDYFNLDRPEFWKETEAAQEFSEVMAFVRTLPFQSTGRIMIMYDLNGKAVTAHRDHPKTEVCNEFIWFRLNPIKPLYMMDSTTGERKYVEGHSAWFDTVNQFHGVDAAEGLSISLRVDGTFTDELRARIPTPKQNPASTPSLWAAMSGHA
jgi:hypothetical protein